MGDTAIEWTDKVWNPTRGCSRVSEGCRHCYAERQAVRQRDGRYAGLVRSTPSGPRWTGAVQLVTDQLAAPTRWRKPCRVFVNSMSDLFHEALPDEAIDRVFGVMAWARRHTYQILTKRADRMRSYATVIAALAPRERTQRFGESSGFPAPPDACGDLEWPLPNVWLGVSVEDQKTADERIPLVLQTPSAVRFVSYEPALGGVYLHREWLGQGSYCATCGEWDGPVDEDGCCIGCGRDAQYHGLDWLIIGGESGPSARPLDLAWARSAVTQCRDAGVACFVKQLGAARPWDSGAHPGKDCTEAGHCAVICPPVLKHPKGGDPAEWPEDLRVREFPA